LRIYNTKSNHCNRKNVRAPKNRTVIESLPFDCWISSIANQVLIKVLRIRGKELPDDQHSDAGSVVSQPVVEEPFFKGVGGYKCTPQKL